MNHDHSRIPGEEPVEPDTPGDPIEPADAPPHLRAFY